MLSINPAIERALQVKLDRDPPFSERILAATKSLAILCATDITDLARFTSLRALILIGYGGRDLTPLAGLPIVSLKVEVSAITGLDIVNELPRLRMLEARNNAITEIGCLADGEHRFVELDLTGNPLSDHSYLEVVPRLRARVPQLRTSGEREWRITRRLYAAGLPFDYYRDDGGGWLCRPGLKFTAFPDADHVNVDLDELEAILDRDPAEIQTLFPRYES